MAWARRSLLLLRDHLGKSPARVIWVFDCCGLESTLKRTHCIPFLTGYCDDSTASWHLEDIVAMVGHWHELGQGWIPEDGIIRQADVRDV